MNSIVSEDKNDSPYNQSPYQKPVTIEFSPTYTTDTGRSYSTPSFLTTPISDSISLTSSSTFQRRSVLTPPSVTNPSQHFTHSNTTDSEKADSKYIPFFHTKQSTLEVESKVEKIRKSFDPSTVEPTFDPNNEAIFSLIEQYYNEEGCLYKGIESYNYFYETVESYIRNYHPIVITDSKSNTRCYRFIDSRITKPFFYDGSAQKSTLKSLYPNECRLRKLDYCGSLLVDIQEDIYDQSGQLVSQNVSHNIKIGEIPIMLMSNRCNLYGMDVNQLVEAKECEYEPGGYFIVKGKEKVLVYQVHIALDRPFIFNSRKNKGMKNLELRNSSDTRTHMFRMEVSKKDASSLLITFANGCSIPALLLYYIYYPTISDGEIYHLLDYSKGSSKYQEIVDLNLASASLHKSSAYLYFKEQMTSSGDLTEDNSNNFLNELFPHLSSRERPLNFDLNINYDIFVKLCYFSKLFISLSQTVIDERVVDDRDTYTNRRIETPGSLMLSIFKSGFEKFIKTLQQTLTKTSHCNTYQSKNNPIGSAGIFEFSKSNHLTNSINYVLSTGNFISPNRKQSYTGISQQLNRHNYASTISHLQKITCNSGKESRTTQPRQLHGSQFGMIDPWETPEGSSSEGIPTGIVLNLSILSSVSIHTEPVVVYKFLQMECQNLILPITYLTLHLTPIFINGDWIGNTSEAEQLERKLRDAKLKGKINRETSIALTTYSSLSLNISTEGGRNIKPFFRKGAPRITKCDENTWKDLLDQGLVEFLDSAEQECFVIDADYEYSSASVEEKKEYVEKENYDYRFIHPSCMFGVAASAMPYPEHSQSPRCIYQCAHWKQAIGVACTNYLERMDTSMMVLNYGQKPMVIGKNARFSKASELPATQNLIIAVSTLDGSNQEDAQGYSKRFVEFSGGFTIYKTFTAEEKSFNAKKNTVIELPSAGNANSSYNYNLLDSRGVIRERSLTVLGNSRPEYPSGRARNDFTSSYVIDRNDSSKISETSTVVRFGTVLISQVDKCTTSGPSSKTTLINRPVVYKQDEIAYVDKVFDTINAKGERTVNVRLRIPRQFGVGDKNAERFAQKGLAGSIVPVENLPFTESGVVPDIIISPFCIPSRMTIGLLTEIMAGKGCALSGLIRDATPFSNFSRPGILKNIREMLLTFGYSSSGRETMYSGITGDKFEADIFMGMSAVQFSRHMANDKRSARTTGEVQRYTRQPRSEGRRAGLAYTPIRAGIMEVDAWKAFGISHTIMERLSSDSFTTSLCSKCNILCCRGCNGADMLPLKLPYTMKLLCTELIAVGIKPIIEVAK